MLKVFLLNEDTNVHTALDLLTTSPKLTGNVSSISLPVISLSTAIYSLFLTTMLLFFFRIILTIKPHNSFITLNIFQYTDFNNNLMPLFYGFIIILFTFQYTSLSSFLTLLIILFQPVLISPLTYLFVFSTSSLLCVSMCQKNSIASTLINDLISMFSFLLRFVSQYIRIILITTVFMLLFEFLDTAFLNYQINSISFNTLTVNNIFVFALRLIIEIVDCFFILLVQISTYFTVLLWLLSFLFLIKFNNVFEK